MLTGTATEAWRVSPCSNLRNAGDRLRLYYCIRARLHRNMLVLDFKILFCKCYFGFFGDGRRPVKSSWRTLVCLRVS